MGGKCLDHYAMPAPPKKIMTSRVVKILRAAGKMVKVMGDFLIFIFLMLV